jgi:CelD/BcsL family acetyltransferase involved in cellulose biosynthesis
MVEALALKREWLRATGRLSRAFLKPEFADCLAELAATLSGNEVSPRLVVSKLSLDDRTAAIEAGICHNRIYHLYLGAFAPEFARLGPGNVLTEKVLNWCVENGIRRYDMLAPRSRNKAEWQTGEVAVLDFALPLTLRGRFYAATVLKYARPQLRRAFYALPLPARSAVTGMALRM